MVHAIIEIALIWLGGAAVLWFVWTDKKGEDKPPSQKDVKEKR